MREQVENYAKHRAQEVEKLFHGLGIRKHAAAIASIVEREIKEAVKYFDAINEKAERER